MPSVTTARFAFNGCTSLVSVTLPSMPELTDAEDMFSTSGLSSIELPSMPKLTNAEDMFSNCKSLVSVTLPPMPELTNARGMFATCKLLESVTLPPMQKVTTARSMFISCESLREIHGWSIPATADSIGLFNGCAALEAVYVSPSTPSADAEAWRSFSVSHGSGTDDTVTVYATDGTVEASATVTNADGRSVEATDWVDELALSDTEIPGSKVADMMSSMIPVTGNTDAADPSQDTFTLWARDGDRLRTNVVQMTDSDFNDIFS